MTALPFVWFCIISFCGTKKISIKDFVWISTRCLCFYQILKILLILDKIVAALLPPFYLQFPIKSTSRHPIATATSIQARVGGVSPMLIPASPPLLKYNNAAHNRPIFLNNVTHVAIKTGCSQQLKPLLAEPWFRGRCSASFSKSTNHANGARRATFVPFTGDTQCPHNAARGDRRKINTHVSSKVHAVDKHYEISIGVVVERFHQSLSVCVRRGKTNRGKKVIHKIALRLSKV